MTDAEQATEATVLVPTLAGKALSADGKTAIIPARQTFEAGTGSDLTINWPGITIAVFIQLSGLSRFKSGLTRWPLESLSSNVFFRS